MEDTKSARSDCHADVGGSSASGEKLNWLQPDPQAPQQTGPRRERDDDYSGVIIQLCETWRVTDCKDGVQWILQRRDAAKPHRGFWRGRRFHVTRTGLIASCVALAGLSDEQALEIIAFLPEPYYGETHYE
jgi:hypothetical protein